ncbi:MAG: hypothetical protein PVJ15_00395 [Gammaproteobacteria bacterium]
MKYLLSMLVAINLLMYGWSSQLHPLWAGTDKTLDHATIPEDVRTILMLSEIDHATEMTTETPEPPQPPAMCHTLGPFGSQAAANEVLAGIAELGKEGTVHNSTEKVKTGYWVYLESMPAQEVEQIIQGLKQKGIDDYHRNEHNELSLGIYSHREGAERRQQSIAGLGYTPQVKPLYRNEVRYWIDVRETGTDLLSDEAWNSWLAVYPDKLALTKAVDLDACRHVATRDNHFTAEVIASLK